MIIQYMQYTQYESIVLSHVLVLVNCKESESSEGEEVEEEEEEEESGEELALPVKGIFRESDHEDIMDEGKGRHEDVVV